MVYKKILSVVIGLLFVLNSKPYAMNVIFSGAKVAAGCAQKAAVGVGCAATGVTQFTGAAGGVMGLVDRLVARHDHNKEVEKYEEEIRTYGGYRSKAEIADRLAKIVDGTSEIKIYGQDKAKCDCFSFSAACLEGIFKDDSSIGFDNGNVIYIIGPPGTGKSTMAYAIADAFLRYKEHTCLLITPERAKKMDNLSGDLGTRLFKYVSKTVNLVVDPQKRGLIRTVINVDVTPKSGAGASNVLVAAPILEHIHKWRGEAVVILDDYDTMKMIERGRDGRPAMFDRSADEIFRSILSSGYYMMGADKIDCSKTLFIITSNETKEQILENFGQGGAARGAPSRLSSIIEFTELDYSSSERLVREMVSNICFVLQKGASGSQEHSTGESIYKFSKVKFSDDTIKHMVEYVFNNKIRQGRALTDLQKGIMGECLKHRLEYGHQPVEILYTPSDTVGELGSFEIRVVEKKSNIPRTKSDDKKDESSTHEEDDDPEFDCDFVDYSKVDCDFMDYSNE